MIRWIAALSSLFLLSGCVTTREVVYRDSGYGESRQYYEADARYARSDYGDETYYEPGYYGGGDYYYGRSYGSNSYGYGSNYSISYLDYPAYYSVFWPIYRSWYDPYWYPNYYYGVTYYPRNYFSFSLGSSSGWPRYANWYYSPYRHSWADNYYDWSPWYGYHSRHRHDRDHRPTPRYGSARNEAERLSRMSDARQSASPRRAGPAAEDYRRASAVDRYGSARSGARDADYGSRAAARQEPRLSGFERGAEARNAGVLGRRESTTAGTRDFSIPLDGNVRRTGRGGGQSTTPTRADPFDRGTDNAWNRSRPATTDDVSRYPARRGIRDYDDAPRGYDRGMSLPRESRSASDYRPGSDARMSTPRDYPPVRTLPDNAARDTVYRSAPRESYRSSAPRESYRPSAPRESYRSEASEYQRAAPRFEARSDPAPQRAYDGGGAAPRYAAPAAESRPAPSARSESRSEGRSESRSESSRSDSGGVRRVGSRRDD
jgi:hypothetical protein